MLNQALLNAQSYSLKAYTPANGLNQSQVTDIFQDSRAYIWIGTRNGLSRFNGLEFENYYRQDGLNDNYIVKILENNKGQIIVVSHYGFSILEETGFKPILIHKNNDRKQISQAEIDSEGKIWLLSYCWVNGIELKSYDMEKLQDQNQILILPDSSRSNNLVYDPAGDRFILCTKNGQIWEYKDNSYKCIRKDKKISLNKTLNGKIITRINNDSYLLVNEKFYAIEPNQYSDKNFIPLTWELIDFKKLILKNRENYLEMPWKNGHVAGIFTDRDHTIWIYGEEGLFRLLSTSFINFTENDGLETNIWSVVEDRNHNIWFGSLNKSLQRWDGRKLVTIESYKKINDGAFFMGSASLYDGRILFTQGDRVLQYKKEVFSEVPYARDQVEKIFQSPVDSSVFIAAVGKGLIIEKKGRIRTLERFSAGKDGWISDIAYDPKGFYWLVTSKTLAKLYPDSVYVYPVEKSPLKSGYVVEVDSTGTPWFGGKEGLFMFDHSSAKFSKLEIEGPMITVNGLALMSNQHLLAGRMKDIVVIDALKFKNSDANFYRIYDAGDGFLGYEVQQDGIMRDHEGNFWISCIDRVVKFIPANDYYLRPPPLLNLDNIEFLNENLNWEKPSSLPDFTKSIPDTIKLHHKQNSLKFNFTGVTSYSSDKVKYSYRLNNRKEWSEPTTQNELLLPELKPGKHELQVKVGNSQNMWSDLRTINLYVVPAFWQTNIFKAGVTLFSVIIIISIVSLIFIQKQRKKERELNIQKEIFSIRIRELGSQFDPHFTFNILSTMGSFIMLNNKEKAYAYLLRFASVLRNVLNGSDQILRPLKEEIEFVKEYCEMQKYRLEDKLEYEITPVSPPAEKIYVPRMVIHSFVENAIKHGIQALKQGGKIKVDYRLENDRILISIRDNGIGRQQAREAGRGGTGKGLSVSAEIFEMLTEYYRRPFQYKIVDHNHNDGKPAGTEVILNLPSKLN